MNTPVITETVAVTESLSVTTSTDLTTTAMMTASTAVTAGLDVTVTTNLTTTTAVTESLSVTATTDLTTTAAVTTTTALSAGAAVSATSSVSATVDGASAVDMTNLSCTNVITNGGFEAGQGGWTIGNTPYAAGLDSTAPYSGTTALRLGVPADAANTNAHSAVRQTVTIPADAVFATLYFWEQAQGDSADYRELLLLSENLGMITTLDRSRDAGDGRWLQRSFDLLPYGGQTVNLYLNVYNDGRNSQLWSYVDEVALVVCQAVQK